MSVARRYVGDEELSSNETVDLPVGATIVFGGFLCRMCIYSKQFYVSMLMPELVGSQTASIAALQVMRPWQRSSLRIGQRRAVWVSRHPQHLRLPKMTAHSQSLSKGSLH